jgi:hypothetical protein
MYQDLRTTQLKQNTVSDNQMFEGEGDAFRLANWRMLDY